MSIHAAVGLVPVRRFDHEGLHQVQKQFLQLMKTLVIETSYWNQTYSYVNAHQRSINLLDNVARASTTLVTTVLSVSLRSYLLVLCNP